MSRVRRNYTYNVGDVANAVPNWTLTCTKAVTTSTDPVDIQAGTIIDGTCEWNCVDSGGGAVNNYSTTEQRIGTWIDGKPLYQITIQDTMPTVTTEGTRVGKSIDVSTLSVENCVKIDGFVYSDGTRIENVPINMFQNFYNGSYLYVFSEMESDLNSNILNHIFIATTRANLSGKLVYITIQYTKLTD